jgi:DNA polymerase-3 subunit beta
MVSTDGSRLSKYDMNTETDMPAGEGILIPKKGLHEISKFLGNSETVQLGIQNSYFVLQSSNEAFYIRLLEGQFPQYDEIVSRDDGFKMNVDKSSFLTMLKRMSILCTDNYRAVMFKFGNGELVINATNPDIGESTEDMPLDYSGTTIEAAFNPKFFIEALNGIDDEKLVVDIISADKPCLINGAEEKAYLSAIMPMRV